MNKLYIKDIIDLGGKLIYGNIEEEIKNISKDTRTLKKGDMYVAIKGESFDGNKFITDAFSKGAKICLTDDKKYKEKHDGTLVYVKNTVDMLQLLAKKMLDINPIPVVAITGSVGKTSTKEMIASVLEEKYKVLKTEGNYNNEIGLPLTVLRLKDEEVAVLEMGMNSFGELSLLTNICKPDIAVITNIGTAHIGELGGRKNILKAKLEILEGLKDNGIFIMNNDDLYLKMAKARVKRKVKRIITCGIENYSDYNANDITKKSFTVNASHEIKLKINNNAFIHNSLIAFAIGKELGVKENKIIHAIEKVETTAGRLNNIKLKNNITLIDDCYNASLESIKESISYMNNTFDNHKIIVLGDVLELGKYSKRIHREIGRELVKSKVEDIVLIGADIKYAKINNAKYFKTNVDGLKYIKSIMKKDDVILLKASNGMKFSEIKEGLENE